MRISRHVYVVDDDDMVRRSSKFCLVSAGYEVSVFPSGAEFIDQAGSLPPGCLLLDVRMPTMDGFGVLDNLNGVRDRFPTVFMTGHGDVATAVRAMKAGAADFLEKPFDDETLFAMLDRIFQLLVFTERNDRQRSDAERRLKLLSPREMDVLRGMVAGFPNKLLAGQLGLSIRTVEMHRANLMEKLDVKALADVLRLAFRAGIVDG